MKFMRTFSAALAACMLTVSCMTPAAVQALDTQPLYGDVTQDGTVDVADAVAIARYYSQDWTLQITDTGRKMGDVNLDGNTDDKDLKMVLEYIARKRTELGVQEEEMEQTYNAVNLTDAVKAGTSEKLDADDVFKASQMKLTVDLLKGAAKDPESENKDLLISPLSVSQALAMTANGAKGETLAEMEKLLGDTLDIYKLNRYYSGYTDSLTKEQDAKLHLANSLWVRNDESLIQVPESFLKTAKDYYHADAFSAPFDQSTVKDVNNWVNYHTHEMIPELIKQMDPNWIMLLINALAFEAEWSNPYDEYHISPQVFHAYDGDTTVEMMRSNEYRYLEDENATGFIKQYKGGEYSFAAILPNESLSVYDYIEKMTPESLQNMLENQSNEVVWTLLPKFKYNYSITMNEMLKNLGMKNALSSGADLTGLNSLGNSYIDLVLHKTFIQVDERGTKAGAATLVAMAAGAALEPEPKYVTLDRPFIYAIIDRETNLPVFIGTVQHPTEA